MDKQELIKAVQKATGYHHDDVRRIASSVFEVVVEALAAGDAVTIRNFGQFTVREVSGRTTKDIGTGRLRWNTDSIVPVFRPSKPFKLLVREGWGTVKGRAGA
ncbi:MAG: hypothetical protein BGO50_10625 [Rhodanobacter sp. 67-28]|nr:MAG: hypothetical protein BGO50_10625 [Rhodanobacter sp. 67-28]